MIRPLVMVLVLLPLAACGWAEWPPPGREQVAVARPAPPKPPETQQAAPEPAPAVAPAVPPAPVQSAALPPIVREPSSGIVGMPRETPQAPGDEHRVREGETLYSVARAHNVDVYALASANGLVAPYHLRQGQTLTIPAAPAARSPAPSEPPRPAVAAVPPSPAKPQPKEEVAAAQPEKAAVPTVGPADSAAPIPAPPPITGDGFIWPLKGEIISSFGVKEKGNQNDGINIAAPRGTPVRATENGVVAYAGNELRGFGNLVLLRHADGWITAYAHNDDLLVKRGDIVRKGQQIATVGNSGGVSEPQLHFQMRQGKSAVDPTKHLREGSV